NGTDTFTYKANDGLDSNIATVTITINAVNDAPIAANRDFTTNEDSSVAVTLAATDKENNTLTYSIVSSPSKGTLTGTGASRTYTPNADVNGTDTFTYKANDGLDSNIATVTITINAVNDAPLAHSGRFVTPAATAVSMRISGSDKEGSTLTYQILTPPSNGQLTGSAPDFTYVPDSGFSGTDTFTFTVNDGSAASAPATITVDVQQPDTSGETGLLSQSGWSLLGFDTEDETEHFAIHAFDGDPDTFWHTRWTSNPTPPPHHISIDLGEVCLIDGFRYLPRQDSILVGNIGNYQFHTSMNGTDWGTPVAEGTFESGSDEKEIRFLATRARYIRLTALSEANSGMHANAAEISVIGTVTTNQAPTVEAILANTSLNTSVPITLDGHDPDGDIISYSIVSGPSNGTLAGTAPDLSYVPSPGFSGTDSFIYQASDGVLESTTALVTIEVTRPNSPPVANSKTFTTSANTAISILLTASDEEDDALNFALVNGPANGRLSGFAPSLAYLPDTGFSGMDRFTFHVSDADGVSQTATISIIVKPGPAPVPNKAPVFHTRPVTRAAGMEGKPYKAASLADAAQDADSDDVLTFTKISGPSWLKIASNGSLSGTPPEDSAGKHQFVIRTFDSENAYAESALLIDIAPAGLPLPWEFDPIGKNNKDAKTSWEGGTFSLRSAGGLNGGADSAGFVWQRLSGDGQIIARVVDVVNGGNTARAGVMIRESLAPNSRHVFMGVTGNGDFRAIRRDRTAKAALVKATGNGKPSNAWVRLVRKGNTITSYKSSDGKDWVVTQVATIKLNARCYIGLATTSGRSTPSSALFRDVKVNP
nr:Ig-like domain-containing protein [Akkermansiaceae bacterium]